MSRLVWEREKKKYCVFIFLFITPLEMGNYKIHIFLDLPILVLLLSEL